MATYYTSSSAAGGGTGAIDSEWTLQEAADSAVADDVVLIKADGTYSPTATIDFDTQAAAHGTPIHFRGAASDGTDDGTTATISGASISSSDIFYINIAMFGVFENLRLTASTARAIELGTSFNTGRVQLVNCRLDNSTTGGIFTSESGGGYMSLQYCEIDNNGAWGVHINAAGRGGFRIYKCSVHDNTSGGIQIGIAAGEMIKNCLIYDNGGDGIDLWNTGTMVGSIASNTIYGNDGDGIDIHEGVQIPEIVQNIMANNGGYGLNMNSETIYAAWMQQNCSFGNTSGHTDVNSGNLVGRNNVLEDPNFVSTTDGSEDLTPQNTNLAAAIAFGSGGTDNAYIGAIQPAASSGGGRRTHAQHHGI